MRRRKGAVRLHGIPFDGEPGEFVLKLLLGFPVQENLSRHRDGNDGESGELTKKPDNEERVHAEDQPQGRLKGRQILSIPERDAVENAGQFFSGKNGAEVAASDPNHVDRLRETFEVKPVRTVRVACSVGELLHLRLKRDFSLETFQKGVLLVRWNDLVKGERIRFGILGGTIGEPKAQGFSSKDHLVFDFVESFRSAGLEGDEVDHVPVRSVGEVAVRDVFALPNVEDVVRSKLQIAARHFVRKGAVGGENAWLSFTADDVTETDLFCGDFCLFVIHRTFA